MGDAHDHKLGFKQALNSDTEPLQDKSTSDEKGSASEFSK